MSKIAIADNNNRKFTQDLIDHWEKKGHEVKFEMGASEYLAQWADLYYVDTFDNNIHYLWKLYHGVEGVSRTPDWNNDCKPVIVVRALDWEVWLGHADDPAILNWVDKIITIAPHIKKRLLEGKEGIEGLDDKIKIIRPGVNLDKFTLKQKKTDGWQLGMVLGDMWKYKNHMGGLDIFTTLYWQDPRWRLHIRGQHENQAYDPVNFQYYLESRGIKEAVTLYDSVEDMNQWLENIDILLHPGQKEGFCYAVGEAMAKGIPAVINEFYGSDKIWKDLTNLYQTHAQAIGLIKEIVNLPIPIEANRQIIFKYYSLERQLKETDEYLGL